MRSVEEVLRELELNYDKKKLEKEDTILLNSMSGKNNRSSISEISITSEKDKKIFELQSEINNLEKKKDFFFEMSGHYRDLMYDIIKEVNLKTDYKIFVVQKYNNDGGIISEELKLVSCLKSILKLIDFYMSENRRIKIEEEEDIWYLIIEEE